MKWLEKKIGLREASEKKGYHYSEQVLVLPIKKNISVMKPSIDVQAFEASQHSRQAGGQHDPTSPY